MNSTGRKLFAGLAVSLLLATVGVVVAFGFHPASDPQGSAYRTLVQFVTDLQKANFYDACQLMVYDGKLNQTTAELKKDGSTFSKERYCAQSWSGLKINVITVYSQPVTVAHLPLNKDQIALAKFYFSIGLIDAKQRDALIKSAQPHTRKLKVPKNGYVFRTSAPGFDDVYVGMQRDKDGHWLVVSFP